MRRSAIPRWPTVSWTGWCMPRPGSHYRESRCGRREVAAVPKRASRRQFAECFWALTPVALRAPYVSAQKHGQPQGRIPHVSRQRKSPKLLTDADHCFTLREPGVASLRSDRHEIGMTDRHHRNPQPGFLLLSAFTKTLSSLTLELKPACCSSRNGMMIRRLGLCVRKLATTTSFSRHSALS